MNVMRSHGEPNLTYVLLMDAEIEKVRNALKGGVKDRATAKELRRRLKEARGQR